MLKYNKKNKIGRNPKAAELNASVFAKHTRIAQLIPRTPISPHSSDWFDFYPQKQKSVDLVENPWMFFGA